MGDVVSLQRGRAHRCDYCAGHFIFVPPLGRQEVLKACPHCDQVNVITLVP